MISPIEYLLPMRQTGSTAGLRVKRSMGYVPRPNGGRQTGMTKQKLIDKLAGLTEPSREADVAIAVFFNYTRKRVSLPRVGLRWFDASGKAVRE